MVKVHCFLIITLIISLENINAQTTRYKFKDLKQNNSIKVFNRAYTIAADTSLNIISLSSGEGDGVAWIDQLDFSNGIIELDIKGKDIVQQSFVGLAFHGINEKVLDAVYFRPFNFESKDSIRKSHAVQYVAHPAFPWKVLREKMNGKYEQSINSTIDPNDWFHVKIVVMYPTIKVYVNNNAQPCLVVRQLNTRQAGKIGLWVGNNSDGDFANLIITK